MYIRYLDCCLRDYFQGSANPTMAIPVDGSTTYREIKEQILLDYNSDGDYYPEIDINKLVGSLLLPIANLDDKAFPDLPVFDPDDTESDTIYMYLDFVN